MGPQHRPTARQGLLHYPGRSEPPATSRLAGAADLYGDDPLAAARGAVNGVLWGAILWAVILSALL